jgi:hypothetical protein
MNKQWIYRNGDKPFSVTEIELPCGGFDIISVVKSGYVIQHTALGKRTNNEDEFDLIPYEPYGDYVIDDEVHCWNNEQSIVESGHWAGLNSEGRPTTFTLGGTSFTRHSLQVVAWFFCEKANKEDR